VTEDNAERIRQAYDAFNRGDLDAAMAFMHEDVEWRMSGAIVGTADAYHGHEGVRQWWLEFLEPFESMSIEPEEIIEATEDRVLVLVRLRATGREGIDVDLSVSHLYDLRGDKVARVQAFVDRDAALAAAGL
jgi:uncharacterized protein